MIDVLGQFALVGAAMLLYFAVRGRTNRDGEVAMRHGHDILRFESALGVDIEHSVQSLVVGHHSVVTLVNWIYIFGHWPVIVATLIWLYRTRRHDYLVLRNALFVSGAIGLVIFAAYPVAPPRLIGMGFNDTVTTFSQAYRVLQPPALVDKYAAIPSLHVGWNLLVGIAVIRASRGNRAMWCLGVASPLLMTVAVIATANHYLTDAAAGSAIALLGLGASIWLTGHSKVVSRSLFHDAGWKRSRRLARD